MIILPGAILIFGSINNRPALKIPTTKNMVEIKSFTFNPFQENTYIAFIALGPCMLVDPGCYTDAEEKELQTFISEKGLEPVALVNTHCHIDHVFGNKFVSDTYGIKLQIPKGEMPVLAMAARSAEMYGLNYSPSPDPIFFDGDELGLGNETFKILNVPGHSPGHVAFYNAASSIVLSGDALFKESIGRTDLPGGNMDTLLESIRKALFTLPEKTKVYAGHMEPTTIGHEKRYNPFLK